MAVSFRGVRNLLLWDQQRCYWAPRYLVPAMPSTPDQNSKPVPKSRTRLQHCSAVYQNCSQTTKKEKRKSSGLAHPERKARREINKIGFRDTKVDRLIRWRRRMKLNVHTCKTVGWELKKTHPHIKATSSRTSLPTMTAATRTRSHFLVRHLISRAVSWRPLYEAKR